MTTPLMTPEELIAKANASSWKLTSFEQAAIAHAKELIELRVLAGRMIEAINKYWSFDDNQQHTHSWHTKQDCLELLRNELRGAGLLPEPNADGGKGERE